MNLRKKYNFLAELNEEQYKAATMVDGPVLVLAGAGSGKTKTIVARTAYLLASQKALTENILIMTFTNKAAREMRERGMKMLEQFDWFEGDMPEFTTFHSWGARFLKNMSREILNSINIKNKYFTIADSSDQASILDKVKTLVLNEEECKSFKGEKFLLTLGVIQNSGTPYENIDNAFLAISKLYENDMLNLSLFKEKNMNTINKIAQIFVLYKAELRKNNSIDFEDLINLPFKIITNNYEIQQELKSKYKYIMIDEFQDTNNSQMRLLKSMLNNNDNICVVGDDSQSIYGWRGADISYILNFHKKFEKCININLAINYRSSKEIVRYANKVLKNSAERHEAKADLRAFKEKEGIVSYKLLNNIREESVYIVNTINFLNNRKNVNYGDIAILYRTAFLVRELEVELINKGIPYKIHNGKTLLERKISRTVISYLKLIHNNDNDISLAFLLVNGGILTDKRLSLFYMESAKKEISLLDYLYNEEYKELPRMSKTVIKKIESFLEEFNYFITLKEDYTKLIEKFFRNNFIRNTYFQVIKDSMDTNVPEKKLNEAESNISIIETINEICKKYKDLDSLLETIAIEGEEDENSNEDKINLMTIHASKGLEFEVVFLMGATNGLFPGKKANSFKKMEEERRLFYVALTRAKHMFRATGAKSYAMIQTNGPLTISRFVKEIDMKQI